MGSCSLICNRGRGKQGKLFKTLAFPRIPFTPTHLSFCWSVSGGGGFKRIQGSVIDQRTDQTTEGKEILT